MSKSETNMASEFWFFSQLHRLGYKSYITLGNTKSIDITLQLSDETLLTFDVKGKASFNTGTYQYLPKIKKENHYFVFIGLQIKREQNNFVTFCEEPQCYIVNSLDLELLAIDWISSDKKTSGYGFDQRILPIIKKYNCEDDIISKSEKRKVNNFKRDHHLDEINFTELKEKILTIMDFENKYHNKK